jgi:hypothetical protein
VGLSVLLIATASVGLVLAVQLIMMLLFWNAKHAVLNAHLGKASMAITALSVVLTLIGLAVHVKRVCITQALFLHANLA